MRVNELLQGLADGEGPITISQAMALRKDLGDLYGRGKHKNLLAGLRRDMETVKSPEWDAARAYTRENVVPFMHDQPLGRLIDKGEPMQVVDTLAAPRDTKLNLLQSVQKQTGGQGPVWSAIRDEFASRAVTKPGFYDRLGPETKRLMFTAPEDKIIRRNISGTELIEQVDKAVGKQGENFDSFTVNRVSKWIDQRKRAAARGDAEATRFVESFDPGELDRVQTGLTNIAKNLSAMPSTRGTPVGSSQRVLWYSLGGLMGEALGLGHAPFGMGGASGVVVMEGVSRFMQTGFGRSLVRSGIAIGPVNSPMFNRTAAALLREQGANK